MKGKAAVFTGAGRPMEIREFPVTDPEPGAIIVRVTMANICGSDLHMWKGETVLGMGPGPWILGHEMTGKVFRLGEGVRTDFTGQPLAEGDRVVYAYYRPCGRCYICLKGDRAACPQRFPSSWLSAEVPPHFNGAYAEYYYLMPGQPVFKVPDELSDEEVAPVNCALSQVIYGLHCVKVEFGDTVVIQGAGGLGLYACAVAREMGAGRVIAIDRLKNRLEMALSFGADEVIDMGELTSPRDRLRRVRELTGGWGADVVVEVAGVPQAVTEGIPMLRMAGRYLWIGNISRGPTAEIDPSTIILGNRRIIGVATYEAWAIPKALDFLKRTRDRYPFNRLLSHKFRLEEINEAFEMASRGEVTRAAMIP